MKNKRKRKNIDEEYRPSLDEINDAEKKKRMLKLFLINWSPLQES